VVEDSLIANGCIISGATVQRCVLSPNVRVDYYADVKDSIIFDDVHIGARARVRRAIIEEGVQVPPGFTIGYDRENDSRRFPISEGGVVIVPNNVDLRQD
jgi:glucose-1-phosphate adenylyltransferase